MDGRTIVESLFGVLFLGVLWLVVVVLAAFCLPPGSRHPFREAGAVAAATIGLVLAGWVAEGRLGLPAGLGDGLSFGVIFALPASWGIWRRGSLAGAGLWFVAVEGFAVGFKMGEAAGLWTSSPALWVLYPVGFVPVVLLFRRRTRPYLPLR